MRRRLPALLVVISAAAAGCSGTPLPSRPPGQPPTPESVTRSNPGGDASDPEWAALDRLLKEPWGARQDRWRTLTVPLADWKKWRRVRIWSHPTRATFRYGDDHFAVATILYTETDSHDDPDSCLDEFWKKSLPIADAFGVRLGDTQLLRTTQDVDGELRPMLVKLVDGSVDSVFASDDYVGAVAAYQSWPATCLIHAFAVKAGTHRDLALKIRERWVSEGAAKLRWMAKVIEAPETKAR